MIMRMITYPDHCLAFGHIIAPTIVDAPYHGLWNLVDWGSVKYFT